MLVRLTQNSAMLVEKNKHVKDQSTTTIVLTMYVLWNFPHQATVERVYLHNGMSDFGAVNIHGFIESGLFLCYPAYQLGHHGY